MDCGPLQTIGSHFGLCQVRVRKLGKQWAGRVLVGMRGIGDLKIKSGEVL